MHTACISKAFGISFNRDGRIATRNVYVGLELYSVRDELAKDLIDTVPAIAQSRNRFRSPELGAYQAHDSFPTRGEQTVPHR
jgi:hypothetical protein